MTVTSNVQVKGLKELGARMRTLSADIEGKIARAGVNAGAQVVKKAALLNAAHSEKTGNLKRNIIVKRLMKSEHTLADMSVVTVRQGGRITKKQKAAGIKSAHYAKFLEFGTVKMSARPFLRPAFDASKDAAVTAIADRLKARIEKAGA